ncbi:MAG: hypothetical protein AAF990_24500 [Bacteroidota bacterium]
MTTLRLLFLICCIGSFSACKTTQPAEAPANSKVLDMTKTPSLRDVGRNAYILVDDRPFSMAEFMKAFRPEDIAVIKAMRKEDAVNKFGPKAADGAVIMISRVRAKYQNQEKLRKLSSAYAKLLDDGASDSDFLYVIDKRPLFKKIDARLYDIPAEAIKKVRIKNQSFVERKYKDKQKKWAIMITTR